MGGFLGIGGSSAKTDRSNVLTGFSDLKNVFNTALPAAQGNLSAGASDTGAASGFWKNILGGNRTAVAQAAAPTTNAALAAGDASKRQAGTMGTARGGGTASINANASASTQKGIDDALFGARTGAAGELAQTGAGETAAGTGLLNTGTNASGDLADIANKARQSDYKINQDTVGKVADFGLNLLGAFGL